MFYFCDFAFIMYHSGVFTLEEKRGSKMGQGACDSNSHRLSSPYLDTLSF
jgi:hypothetical protein